MNGAADRDEILERLWQLAERGASTLEGLKAALHGHFRQEDLDQLAGEGLVRPAGDGDPALSLTAAGKDRAGRLIRAHRIGERLIHDVMGVAFESGACEFEHIPATEIVDGICTLLGHPRECPHGFPIPEGECCRASARYAQRRVVPVTELALGEAARVAWVHARSDQQLLRLTSLQIRPGAIVKLTQLTPSCVIECDGAAVALDGEVARSISVWRDTSSTAPEGPGDRTRAPRRGVRRARRPARPG